MTVFSTYRKFTLVNSQSKFMKNRENNVIESMLKHFGTVNYGRRKNCSLYNEQKFNRNKKIRKILID
jgi:hypothetical protein